MFDCTSDVWSRWFVHSREGELHNPVQLLKNIFLATDEGYLGSVTRSGVIRGLRTAVLAVEML